MLKQLGLALAVLTRLPAGWLAGPAPADPARAVWAFPLAGAAVGAGGALVLAAGTACGLPPALAACWATAALALLSGALHEDGLADMADGFGGGHTAERKLAIMRDSRIGSYGALALVLAIATRLAAIAALAHRPTALIAAGAVSRGAMGVLLLLLRPVRDDGLGATLRDARAGRLWCLGIAVALAVALLGLDGLRALAAGLAAAACIGWLAWRQVGGYTGDVLGGCAVVAECAALTAMAST